MYADAQVRKDRHGDDATVSGVGGGWFGWAAGWGPKDDEESVGDIKACLELGVKRIDTAASTAWGLPKRSSPAPSKGVSERTYVFQGSMVWEENGERPQHQGGKSVSGSARTACGDNAPTP